MDLAAVMDDIAARLDTIPGLKVRAWPDPNPNPPEAIVTFPTEYPFDRTFERGADGLLLPVVVVVGNADTEAARDRVSRYVSGSGVQSIKAVLEADAAPSFLDLPGTANNYANTGSDPTMAITGALTVTIDVAADDWTPAAFSVPVAKWNGASQRSFEVRIGTTGLITLGWTANGSTFLSAASTVAPAVANGVRRAIRAKLTPDNGAAGRTITFEDAPTRHGPFAPLGAPVVQAGVTSVFTSSSPLEVGSDFLGTGNLFAGNVFGIEVADADGSIVAPEFDGQPFGTLGFLDRTGHAWSVNGSALIAQGAPVGYSSFDSVRVQHVEFDIIAFGRVEYLTATLLLDIIGPGD